MLMAVQNQSKAPSSRRTPKKTDVRKETLKALNATWRKICPLEGEELRDARLAFATRALSLRKPLTSMGKLSPAQLGRILDEMRRHERAPALPGIPLTEKQKAVNGVGISSVSSVVETAEIHHLATDAQVDAIGKLFAFLKWSPSFCEGFIAKRFNGRTTARLLSPSDANALTNILFNTAAHRRIKSVYEQLNVECPKISRVRIRAEIPALKRELGIDQRKVTTEDTEDDYEKAVSGAAWEFTKKEQANEE